MTTEARIIVTRHEVWRGKYYDTYEWMGPRNAPVLIGFEYDIKKLPWPLRKIEDSQELNASWCVRTDITFWWLIVALSKIKNAAQWINVRLIVTAHIWGIGYIEHGAIPTWRSLLKKK